MTPTRAFRSPAATTQFGGPGRANTRLFERPDRLPRACSRPLPYGTGLLAGLAASAARYPEVVAVTGPGERMTTGRCGQTDALAAGLRAHGLSEDTTVGVRAAIRRCSCAR